MTLAYPIASSLDEAIRPGARFARSRHEAEALSPGMRVGALETSWLHLSAAEADALFGALGGDGPAGHLQRYEDTSGHIVVAVSWWKVIDPRDVVEVPPPPPPTTDHTDDLYFRRARARTRRRKRLADPNQLDLFAETRKE